MHFRGGVESNRTNFEQIQHLKNLTPPYSWSRIESNAFGINFHRIFQIFLPFRINRIANFRIELNEFRTNSNLTPPLVQNRKSLIPKFIKIHELGLGLNPIILP